MSYRKNFVLGALLAATWIVPQGAWATKGKLPAGAYKALVRAARSNTQIPKSAEINPAQNRHLSANLQTTKWVKVRGAKGEGQWKAGRAYVERVAGANYLVAEKLDSKGETASWKAYPLGMALRADGIPSTLATKRVTRLTSNRGEIRIAFVNAGLAPGKHVAVGITAKGALTANSPYRGGRRVSSIVAESIDPAANMVTYYAVGRAAGSSEQAVVETTIQGGPAMPFSRQLLASPALAAKPAPTTRHEGWNPVTVIAQIE